jgi:hypothetical protein
LASTRSKETTIKVQYWVKRHELLRQIGPNWDAWKSYVCHWSAGQIFEWIAYLTT